MEHVFTFVMYDLVIALWVNIWWWFIQKT